MILPKFKYNLLIFLTLYVKLTNTQNSNGHLTTFDHLWAPLNKIYQQIGSFTGFISAKDRVNHKVTKDLIYPPHNQVPNDYSTGGILTKSKLLETNNKDALARGSLTKFLNNINLSKVCLILIQLKIKLNFN